MSPDIINDFIDDFINDFPPAGEAGGKIINGTTTTRVGWVGAGL